MSNSNVHNPNSEAKGTPGSNHSPSKTPLKVPLYDENGKKLKKKEIARRTKQLKQQALNRQYLGEVNASTKDSLGLVGFRCRYIFQSSCQHRGTIKSHLLLLGITKTNLNSHKKSCLRKSPP